MDPRVGLVVHADNESPSAVEELLLPLIGKWNAVVLLWPDTFGATPPSLIQLPQITVQTVAASSPQFELPENLADWWCWLKNSERFEPPNLDRLREVLRTAELEEAFFIHYRMRDLEALFPPTIRTLRVFPDRLPHRTISSPLQLAETLHQTGWQLRTIPLEVTPRRLGSSPMHDPDPTLDQILSGQLERDLDDPTAWAQLIDHRRIYPDSNLDELLERGGQHLPREWIALLAAHLAATQEDWNRVLEESAVDPNPETRPLADLYQALAHLHRRHWERADRILASIPNQLPLRSPLGTHLLYGAAVCWARGMWYQHRQETFRAAGSFSAALIYRNDWLPVYERAIENLATTALETPANHPRETTVAAHVLATSAAKAAQAAKSGIPPDHQSLVDRLAAWEGRFDVLAVKALLQDPHISPDSLEEKIHHLQRNHPDRLDTGLIRSRWLAVQGHQQTACAELAARLNKFLKASQDLQLEAFQCALNLRCEKIIVTLSLHLGRLHPYRWDVLLAGALVALAQRQLNQSRRFLEPLASQLSRIGISTTTHDVLDASHPAWQFLASVNEETLDLLEVEPPAHVVHKLTKQLLSLLSKQQNIDPL